MKEISRNEAIKELLNPQFESLENEYRNKADEEIEEEYELAYKEKIKITTL